MKKILITFVAIVVLSAVLPGYVGAQAYTTTAGCLVLSNDLSLGMQGSDVSQLQGFLAEQGYSGGLSESSYFGQATQQAVVGFQSAHGIPGTGYVGSLTRAALANCQYLASSYASSYAYPAQYQNQYQYQSYPYTNPAPLAYTSQYSYAPVISSVSPTVAAPGDTVIIYGNGFDSQGNSVSAGGVQVQEPSFLQRDLSLVRGAREPLWHRGGVRDQLARHQQQRLARRLGLSTCTGPSTGSAGMVLLRTRHVSVLQLLQLLLLPRSDHGAYSAVHLAQAADRERLWAHDHRRRHERDMEHQRTVSVLFAGDARGELERPRIRLHAADAGRRERADGLLLPHVLPAGDVCHRLHHQ